MSCLLGLSFVGSRTPKRCSIDDDDDDDDDDDTTNNKCNKLLIQNQ